MESRYYPGVEADVIKLMTELRDLFDEDFEIQTMNVSSTAVLQARKSSTLRDITGLSAALTIKVTPETGGTRVEMGMQKWFDKAAIAAVAAVLFFPLLALPAIVPTTTREFANLANLGLVIVEDETGIVTLTPLGKSWAVTQELLP